MTRRIDISDIPEASTPGHRLLCRGRLLYGQSQRPRPRSVAFNGGPSCPMAMAKWGCVACRKTNSGVVRAISRSAPDCRYDLAMVRTVDPLSDHESTVEDGGGA